MTWPWQKRRPRERQEAVDPVVASRAMIGGRLVVAAGILAVWAVGVEARLVYLQVFQHDALVSRAERQQSQSLKAAAKRGDIVDRRGRVLATSVDADSICAVPAEVGDEAQVVSRLCAAFGDCTPRERQDLIERLKKQRYFAYIRRQVSPELSRKIQALNLDGIFVVKESRRYYPKNSLGAHLLGFVNVDGKGLSGVESAYDTQIRGRDGQLLVHTDARRHAFGRIERPPTTGSTIELTVDEYLQHVAQRELHAGVLENRAAGGSVVIMNPRTGEILAMANEPTFDPNSYREASDVERRNRAVQDLYEPGSTFKVVTASAAIEEKIMPLDAPIDTSGGQIRIGSRVVRDTHDYGVLTFTDVMVKSSNVGAIRLGFKLGSDRLSDYVQKFGFGRPVSPDFPSENPGIVWDRAKWSESALASVSMGYQVGVTPLQMTAAVSAIANHGGYVEPRVVRAVYKDGRRYEVKPKTLLQTVTPGTAASLTSVMEQIVERGTATLAKIPGYAVAGKTGTANKLVNGRYGSDTHASFVGFLPAQDPAFTILVVLDAPRGPNGHYGGPVSAPIFRRIAEAALRHQGIAPSVNRADPVLVARDGALPLLPASTTLEDAPQHRPAPAPGMVPDVRGLSARDAMRTLMQVGMSARLSGDGFVVAQEPEPGSPITESAEGRLTLARSGDRGTARP
jgi:cell division protein FtsI (penicillin-binding protein 3)